MAIVHLRETRDNVTYCCPFQKLASLCEIATYLAFVCFSSIPVFGRLQRVYSCRAFAPITPRTYRAARPEQITEVSTQVTSLISSLITMSIHYLAYSLGLSLKYFIVLMSFIFVSIFDSAQLMIALM